ncbi:hypothetical protein C1H46_045510 [Malus baccata]|uniref:Uncharacterized protein n=1 Tax=Malus baccata TaxID=106549 RepID=A0A540K402_MALBA|nr:hypothetical protein C1H46_045510 [Malus baccata]
MKKLFIGDSFVGGRVNECNSRLGLMMGRKLRQNKCGRVEVMLGGDFVTGTKVERGVIYSGFWIETICSTSGNVDSIIPAGELLERHYAFETDMWRMCCVKVWCNIMQIYRTGFRVILLLFEYDIRGSTLSKTSMKVGLSLIASNIHMFSVAGRTIQRNMH